MKSIAIVGAGAVGSFYGGKLAKAGNDVRFLMRLGCEMVRKTGLRVESTDGDFFLPEISCARKSEDLGPVDVVIVAWKATANKHFKEVIKPLLHEDTVVLTLQNGLGNIEALGDLFGIERILGGMCFVCINRIEPGHVRHTGGGMITIGEARGGATPRLRKLAALFAAAGVKCEVSEDFAETQWRKLIWNIPFNGLCITEGGIDTGALLAMPDGEDRVRELMEEVVAIASAHGHEIEDEYVDYQIRRTYPMADYKPSSMLDFVNGNPVEIQAIWGIPYQRAVEKGIAAPCLMKLLAGIMASVHVRSDSRSNG